jgi:membrane dipeptidase
VTPLDLHHDAVVADTHNDLLMLVVRRPVQTWSTYFGEHWVPQLRTGGVDIQVLPVFIDDEFRPEGSLRETLRMIEAAHRVAEGNAGEVALCRDGAEIDAALASGRIALVLALEGCPQIDEDVELLETVARLGVRVVSFAHFGRSALADGSAENATGSRLTTAGVEALGLLESLGVIVDISHVGYSGVDHILELATRPLIATHSSAYAVREHHRNLDDTQLKAVADTGGVVCVNFFAGFVDAESPTMDRLVDHIAHIAGTIGIEHVGLGPDFVREVFEEKIPMCDRPVIKYGMDLMQCVPGLEGPRGLPLVTEALLGRGFSESEVRAVLGGNVHRLFRAELGRPTAG